MKKLTTILFVASALLVGCEKPQNYQTPLTYDVKYRGHNYIVFRVSQNFGQSYVHDPDCQCNKAR